MDESYLSHADKSTAQSPQQIFLKGKLMIYTFASWRKWPSVSFVFSFSKFAIIHEERKIKLENNGNFMSLFKRVLPSVQENNLGPNASSSTMNVKKQNRGDIHNSEVPY